jgi:hypothetical protein
LADLTIAAVLIGLGLTPTAVQRLLAHLQALTPRERQAAERVM